MANLDQIIDFTKTFQDIELATAIGQLKNNPTQLQQFLQDQQDKVFKNVTKQKESTFEKVYGDLNRASQAQNAVMMYNESNTELAKLNKKIYDNQRDSVKSLIDDKNLSKRKYEMNEWSVNDKKDTLFVFSMLFIILSGLIFITVLWRLGIISKSLWVALVAPLILVLVLTVINRTQYTNIFRDKRYWNRKVFEGKYGKIPVPNICPGSLSSMEANIEGEFSNIKSGIEAGITSTEKDITSGIDSAKQTISNVTQSAEKDMSNIASYF
jgi:ABC-type multidrug transport system fused ATPase/permease subunit